MSKATNDKTQINICAVRTSSDKAGVTPIILVPSYKPPRYFRDRCVSRREGRAEKHPCRVVQQLAPHCKDYVGSSKCWREKEDRCEEREDVKGKGLVQYQTRAECNSRSQVEASRQAI
jgi:hypothetical protein